jgi:hypothetical protein
MSVESEAYFKARQEFREAGAALRTAENATRVAQDTFDRAKRRLDDLEAQLGPSRVHEIKALGQ